MKVEICSFTGYKIYPSRGRLFVRSDSRIFRFIDSKTESLFHQGKNPRKIAWTTVFRRQHKKGISEEVAKKRTRRAVKSNRGFVGADWQAIKAKRSEKPEVRAAARAQAIKKAKEERKKAAAEKKTSAPAHQQQKFSKMQSRGAQTKVKPTSR
ncbi:60S ribosomal protein L24 [Mycoemilia scoparia]|uniref:60S ribosomal protein L24 n=1 Tax=Mycoemilia scoparia TaxID=417184 RepID=A0A9W8A062_9FUNG|nr:60S ribosomal protein L24 [Mycoemilia scoparia]